MDEDVKTDIAVIKNKMENMNDKMNRFISHLESEQRVTNNISKRVDVIESWMKWTQEKESNNKWRFEQVISLVSLMTTLGLLFIEVMKK